MVVVVVVVVLLLLLVVVLLVVVVVVVVVVVILVVVVVVVAVILVVVVVVLLLLLLLVVVVVVVVVVSPLKARILFLEAGICTLTIDDDGSARHCVSNAKSLCPNLVIWNEPSILSSFNPSTSFNMQDKNGFTTFTFVYKSNYRDFLCVL